eukprot:evm.model.scf_590.9 EVM.evm.TU.scf_590.9   scf_590:73201-75003(-)
MGGGGVDDLADAKTACPASAAEIRCLLAKLKAPLLKEAEARQAAWRLSLLARSPENRAAVAAESGLQILIDAMKKGPASCRGPAASAVASMALGVEYGRALIGGGTIQSLVRLLKDRQVDGQEDVLQALANLAHSSEARGIIVVHGGLELAIHLLESDNGNSAFQALRVLTQISADSDFRCEAGSSLATDFAARLLMDGSEEEEKKLLALEFLANVAGEPQSADALVACGIPALVHTVEMQVGKGKAEALRALASLAERESPGRAIVAEGGIQPIIDSLSDGSCAPEAARCLANLSCNVDICQVIVNRGGVPKLVLDLHEPTSGHVGHSVFAIANISESLQGCKKITEAGGVPQLVKLVIRGAQPFRLSALRALSNLSESLEDNRDTIGKSRGLYQCVVLLRSGCERTAAQAVRLLASLAEYGPNRRLIGSAGAIQILIHLLTAPNRAMCRLNAARALADLCHEQRCRVHLVQLEGIGPLVGVCGKEKDPERVQAARALHNLAMDPHIQRSIVWEGGVSVLVEMLHSANFEVREQALHTLIRLGMLHEHWGAIKHEGGFIPLTRQLIVSEVRDAFTILRHVVRFFNGVFGALLMSHWRRV